MNNQRAHAEMRKIHEREHGENNVKCLRIIHRVCERKPGTLMCLVR